MTPSLPNSRRDHLTPATNAVIIERLERRELLSASFLRSPILTRLPATPQINATTIPANGDVNPYGVAIVPKGFTSGGPLVAGDVLVSNFNSSANLQGTGTTIVSVAPSGTQSVFFQGPAGLGLTTALGVLKNGFVLVGNVPTTDGTSATVGQGSLLILNRSGQQVAALTDAAFLDGPWDLTVHDQGSKAQVFVSNVLSGTVTRLDLKISHHAQAPVVVKSTQIASGYLHRTDPAALVVGPTGLVYDAHRNKLYVASTGDNAIYAISNPLKSKTDQGKGVLVYSDPAHLRGPLALAQAPNGDLLTANGDAVNPSPDPTSGNSEIVEFTPAGAFVAQIAVNPAPGGAFGLAVTNTNKLITLATVNDITNTLEVFDIIKPKHGH